jgi:hypothetical protein
MKCAKSKKLIYLYNELHAVDRSMLDQHLKTCERCRSLLTELQTYQKKIQHHLLSPVATDEMLTDRIMNAVIAPQTRTESSLRDFLAAFTSRHLSRAAFAALSLLLVAAFITEVNHPSLKTSSISNEYVGASIKSVSLNSQTFGGRSDSLAKKSFATTFAACLSICKNNNQGVDCEACQSRIKKLRTIYAKI